MRVAMAGEDDVKACGERFLPMKSGTRAIEDDKMRMAAYDGYRLRAEFPEVVAPTVRGAVGVVAGKVPQITLPKGMDYLLERATRDGLKLEALHRRILMELLVTGRYGLLPGVSKTGAGYLAGYVAEAITNWHTDDETRPDWLILDETGLDLDRGTGSWERVVRYRECALEGGRYTSRIWSEQSGAWLPTDEASAETRHRKPLEALPFTFIGSVDLTPEPDDVPLYGLAKLALRVYRLDADYTCALHLTSEPTPWASGFNDPGQAIRDGVAPNSLGGGRLWLLPEGAQAGYLEFSGPGITAQETAIRNSLERAAAFGANLLSGSQKAAESGDALRLRLGSQTATLKSIAMTAAAGLQDALRNLAVWLGENPDEVTITPDVEFFDQRLDAQELTALVAGWQSGAYSYPSLFERLQKGGVIPESRTVEDEQALRAKEDIPDDDETGLGLTSPPPNE